MDTLMGIAVEVLRLIPLILAFFVPALLGMALLKERGEGYKIKAVLVFLIGFGSIIGIQLLIRNVSTLQVLTTLGVSLTQAAVALLIAAFTVYKLAD
jgi:TctA family transporter